MERSPSPPRERPGSGNRFIANLAYLAPGYQGYKTIALRQDEDARLRSRVLRHLADLGEQLQRRAAVFERLSLDIANSQLKDNIDRISRIEQAVRFSPVGFTGFFERENLPETCIEKILEKDLLLFQDFDEALEMVHGTPFPPSTKTGFVKFFAALDNAIDRIESRLISRDRILSSC